MIMIVEQRTGEWLVKFPNGHVELFPRLDFAVAAAQCEPYEFEIIETNYFRDSA